MASDLIELGVRLNLVLAGAIALVLALRAPVRRLFGARLAYALWLMPPLAAAMCFAPRRVQIVHLPAQSALTPEPYVPVVNVFDPSPVVLGVWIGGALLLLAVLALRQHRFVRSLGRLARRGGRVFGAQSLTGPAVVGALWPKIVTPADFEHRYSAEERDIVLAHERAHMRQGDPLINALAALTQCVNWFNPLVHLGVRALRVDQELSCDAAVMAEAGHEHVGLARRVYAEAMLKAHAAPLGPLVCAWPAPSLNPLKERIAMLKRNPPSRAHLMLGGAVVVLATFSVCATAWTAQPAKVVAVRADTNAPHAAEALRLAQDDPSYTGSDSADIDPDIEINSPEFEAEINELTASAMRLAHQALISADLNMRHDQAMTAEERAQLERDMRANAEEVRRSALEQARAAMQAARAELDRQRPLIDAQVRAEMRRQRPIIDAQARAELRAQAEELREQARQMRAERSHLSAEERSQREAEIESHAQEIAAHAMSIAQRAIEDAMAGFDEEAPEAAPELEGAPDDEPAPVPEHR